MATFGLITTLVFSSVMIGFSYAILVGAVPAITYISFHLSRDNIDPESILVHTVVALVLLISGYVVMAHTVASAEILMVVSALAILYAFINTFVFTSICIILCYIVGEAFLSHLWA